MDYHVAKNAKITSPQGFTAAGIASGIKKRQALDLGAIVCEVPAVAAAVFTTNAFQAAPILITKQSLAVEGKLQAVIVNSGIANAGTGEQGLANADQMRRIVAEQLKIPAHYVGVASTGVIGEQLPMQIIQQGIEKLLTGTSKQGADDFAQAILTTDTFSKTAEVRLTIDGQQVTVAGCAKGSGMIHPQMATMLGFLTTDAHIAYPALQQLLREVTDETFNMVTVDGDCSTNDTVVVMANGLANNSLLHPDHPEWSKFRAAFSYVCRELAKQLARDGEGATKLIEVCVEGAINKEQARTIAKSIVGSSLVKTAVFGEDANWGRILCAMGYGDPTLDPQQVDLWMGEILLVRKGQPLPLDEEEAKAELEKEKVFFLVDLHQGDDSAVAWGCDLTYDYVKINASYRT